MPGPGRMGGGPRGGPRGGGFGGPGPGRMGGGPRDGFGGDPHRPSPPPPPPPHMGYRRRRVFGWGRPWVGYGPGGGCFGCILPVLVGVLLLVGIAALLVFLL